MSISTLLIANRGEIACRIMRTARALNIRTIALYSEADRNAKHVKMADDAFCIGGNLASESYLDADRILRAAQQAGADAIHPGYGSLSESADFARACSAAGIVFVGPSAEAIEIMGDKAKAKRAMIEAGVNCVQGYQGDDQSDHTLLEQAKNIGMPIMVKAAAGGGGRGMRLVSDPADLPNAINLARAEAISAFGSDALIIEKAIIEPRHVEIQVFADAQGNTIHLGERDCSVQRRHQKVLEEAPCPVMTDDLRSAMGQAAVKAARAVQYCGAGTVEFLLDNSGNYYFLEMNTRLQVEHPVTEAVTGLDLVALQIAVAEGAPIGLSQDDVTFTGHAIEARLYTEDPALDFLPSTGNVDLWSPASGVGIRVDDGICTGDEITPFYDAMVAKIIVTGENRASCLRRLNTALKETALFGVPNNRDFLIDAINQPVFVAGEATTAFIQQSYGEDGFKASSPKFETIAAAALEDFAQQKACAEAKSIAVAQELSGWSNIRPLVSTFEYGVDGTVYQVTVTQSKGGFSVACEDRNAEVNFDRQGPSKARLCIDGRNLEAQILDQPECIHVSVAGQTVTFSKLNTLSAMADKEIGDGMVIAPMHGMLVDVFVKEGERVAAGDPLVTLEAMKMQHEITAEAEGVVAAILVSPGTQISASDPILQIAHSETDKK